MKQDSVLTLTGPDRIGIVDDLTRLLLERGSNVETSRMARLGGQFAILMLVSLPADEIARLDESLKRLTDQGYKVTTTPAGQSYAEAHPGWLPYRIEVNGADHEGIIQEVAHYLRQFGISIESMESETSPAPISGVPLFAMTARVVVPPDLAGQGWEAGLEQLGIHRNLDIRLSEAKDSQS
jgi:glycine cleavage system transcriptional repressor